MTMKVYAINTTPSPNSAERRKNKKSATLAIVADQTGS
jgi:hypothetical protein